MTIPITQMRPVGDGVDTHSGSRYRLGWLAPSLEETLSHDGKLRRSAEALACVRCGQTIFPGQIFVDKTACGRLTILGPDRPNLRPDPHPGTGCDRYLGKAIDASRAFLVKSDVVKKIACS